MRARRLPRWLAHAMVLVIIVAVVAGRGYWSAGRPAVHPGGIDRVGDLSRVRLPAVPAAGAAPSSAVPAGVSRFSGAVGPRQLHAQSASSRSGVLMAEELATGAPTGQAPAAVDVAGLGVATGHFIWPTTGVITQYYGPTAVVAEPPFHGYAHFHQGVDIANHPDTPIVAADGGTVIFSGWSSVGLGNCVAIDHGNGFITWYGHLAELPAVTVGQRVAQGQYLGPLGSTGDSSGPHTHFAMLRDGVLVDPLAFLH